jgi:vacuolar-type H+-ATPase subunit I/STV1
MEKTQVKPEVTPEIEPKATEQPKADVEVEVKDEGGKQDDFKAQLEKQQQESRTWEGRYNKLQEEVKMLSPLKKLAEALLGNEANEVEEPAMVALRKVEQLEQQINSGRAEIAKRDAIDSMDIPSEVKEVLKVTVPAGEDFEVRANAVVERLAPLIDKKPIKPVNTGFVGRNYDMNMSANEILKMKQN